MNRLCAFGALALAFTSTAAWPQAHDPLPVFQWAQSAGGLSNDKTRCVTTDAQGNVFLTGEMTGDATFGEITLKSGGGMDFFVAKLDPAGKFLWARHGGGSLVDRGYGVATDAKGNCYVTGHCQGSDVEFEGTKLHSAGDYDVFVAKYDPDGKLLWIRTAGGKGYDYGHGVAVDGNGDVIVAGAVVGESKFGETVIPYDGGGHPFCAKYSSNGDLLWVKTTEGKVGGSGHGVAVDGKGNIFVGGLSSGTGTFGGKPLITPKGTGTLVAKLSPQGVVLWIAQSFGEPSCLVHEITADSQGRVWVSGMFKGSATFGSERFTTTGDKDSDAFLSHYDAEGKLLWTRVGQGPAVDYGLGVVADGEGNAYLTGEFTADFKLGGATLKSLGTTDVYVAKFDAQGDLRWLIQAGGDKGDNAYTMARDSRGALIIAGSFSGTTAWGTKSLSSPKSSDLYAAKLVPATK